MNKQALKTLNACHACLIKIAVIHFTVMYRLLRSNKTKYVIKSITDAAWEHLHVLLFDSPPLLSNIVQQASIVDLSINIFHSTTLKHHYFNSVMKLIKSKICKSKESFSCFWQCIFGQGIRNIAHVVTLHCSHRASDFPKK